MTNEQLIPDIPSFADQGATVLLETGYLYMGLGRARAAEEIFQNLALLVPTSEAPYLALGQLYFSQGRFDSALSAHERAVELNPSCAPAWASAGETLFFLRQPKNAVERLDMAISLDPDGPAGDFAKVLKGAHGMGVFG